VEDSAFVRVLDGVGQRLDQSRRCERCQRLAGKLRGEVGTIHQVHGEILQPLVLAHLVDGDDVGMLQFRRRCGFGAETLDDLGSGKLPGRHQLHRHHATQAPLSRAPDDPHAALGDFPEQFVIPELPDEGRSRAAR
jgi:hypothetical protein